MQKVKVNMSYTDKDYLRTLQNLLNANKALLLSKTTLQGMFYLGEDYLDSYLRDHNRVRLLLGMSPITKEHLPTTPTYTSWYIPFHIK
jgi:hypothetical protein